jgi:anti-sigma regulatory factor (Ser/Thr protein kinase)
MRLFFLIYRHCFSNLKPWISIFRNISIRIRDMQDNDLGNNTDTTILRLKIINQLSEIDRVNEAFNVFCAELGLDDAVRREVNLMFDELLNNIISYAFQDEKDHFISIQVSYQTDTLKITLSDDGVSYNLLQTPSPPTDQPLADRPIGGLGVFLVRQLMDEMDYQRHDGKNISTLIKYLDEQAKGKIDPLC